MSPDPFAVFELGAGATFVPFCRRARICCDVDSSLETEVSRSSKRVSVVTSELTERSPEGDLRIDLVVVDYVREVEVEFFSLGL